MIKLSIVIVNYNTGIYLSECLSSLKKANNEIKFDTWVIDNASVDSSIQKAQKNFPEVKFILNNENLGFGKANNIVLRQINTEYILLLNPDTFLEKEVLKKMVSYMDENPNVGAASCKIMLSNGFLDLTAHRGFPTPWASFKYYFLKDDSLYHLTDKNMNEIHEVDAISGAFFLTRKSVLDKVGLFDEDYFMYAEDIDLCFRIKQSGFRIIYIPSIKILHHKGISTGLKKHSQRLTTATLETRRKMIDYFYDTMKIFYKKHLDKSYQPFVNWLVYLGIDLKRWLAKRKMTV